MAAPAPTDWRVPVRLTWLRSIASWPLDSSCASTHFSTRRDRVPIHLLGSSALHWARIFHRIWLDSAVVRAPFRRSGKPLCRPRCRGLRPELAGQQPMFQREPGQFAPVAGADLRGLPGQRGGGWVVERARRVPRQGIARIGGRCGRGSSGPFDRAAERCPAARTWRRGVEQPTHGSKQRGQRQCARRVMRVGKRRCAVVRAPRRRLAALVGVNRFRTG